MAEDLFKRMVSECPRCGKPQGSEHCLDLDEPMTEQDKAHWEAVADEDDQTFWRVRWSEPDAEGRYLYVRHYGAGSALWNEHVARTSAEDFNEIGRSPYEWDSYRPKRKEIERVEVDGGEDYKTCERPA